MSNARDFLGELQRKLAAEEEADRPIPDATPPLGHRRLCVGMATFDDYDGTWFTIESILMHHPEVAGDLSLLILDNHPEGAAADALKGLESRVPHLRYVPFRGYRSTAVRDLIFRESEADIVCCLDSHVLLMPGALAAIIRYFDDYPESLDLLQGPLLGEDTKTVIGTHFDPRWSDGMYGMWGTDAGIENVAGEPFDVPMQGLGMFACRRDAWPGINSRFRGFGGEEGYLHEKFRQRGGRTLCHPELGWVHRFDRPGGPPYRLNWEDRLRNYRVGWTEIGWDIASMESHFRELEGMHSDAILAQSERQLASPFSYFDGIFHMDFLGQSRREEAMDRFHALDIGWRVERHVVTQDVERHRVACVAGWRAMVEAAQKRGYDHVVGFEGDVNLSESESRSMGALVRIMEGIEWDLCFLGAHLAEDGNDSCQRTLAVHRRAFARILTDIPSESSELPAWLDEFGSLNRYIERRAADGTFKVLHPAASEPSQVHEDGSAAARGPYSNPAAWTGAEIRMDPTWRHQLTEQEIGELEAAVRGVERRGLPLEHVEVDAFSLPTLAPAIAGWRKELEEGRGFALVKGLPVGRMSEAQAAIAYCGIASHLGTMVEQNPMGEKLIHVRATGEDPNDVSVRHYKTGVASPFHTDSSDVVGLLCLRPARFGGLSSIASSVSVFNAMLAKRPDLVDEFFTPFYFDLYEQQADGADPNFAQPLSSEIGGQLSTFYIRFAIDQAQRHTEVPRLTESQTEFLNLLDELASSDDLRLDMDFEPGDMQFLNNSVILHARSAFEDGDDPAQGRHLLRLWLTLHS
jgi:Taurine catabolism dioxygenase TauD, TfdA family